MYIQSVITGNVIQNAYTPAVNIPELLPTW
ncbi:hypothetical protein JMG10_03940 [Nostoc ellipsosporum NOK]|nr:hypothetical protein [Nostoc ellipsosporum NOK]